MQILPYLYDPLEIETLYYFTDFRFSLFIAVFTFITSCQKFIFFLGFFFFLKTDWNQRILPCRYEYIIHCFLSKYKSGNHIFITPKQSLILYYYIVLRTLSIVIYDIWILPIEAIVFYFLDPIISSDKTYQTWENDTSNNFKTVLRSRYWYCLVQTTDEFKSMSWWTKYLLHIFWLSIKYVTYVRP